MPRDLRTGRAWQLLIEQCKAVRGWTCHLCGQPIPRHWLPLGHPLKYEADHVLSYDEHPALRMALSNLRPSHGRCNRYRGKRTLTPALVAEITAKFATRRPALDFFEGRGVVTQRDTPQAPAGDRKSVV